MFSIRIAALGGASCLLAAAGGYLALVNPSNAEWGVLAAAPVVCLLWKRQWFWAITLPVVVVDFFLLFPDPISAVLHWPEG